LSVSFGLDLSDEGFLDTLDQDREGLHRMLRLNSAAHLDLAHHFGRRLAERGRGGLLLVSSLGARQRWPGAAGYAASKAFVMVLGESLHVELGKLGVSVTVLLPGATETEMVRSYGVDAATMNQMMRPMRLMSVDQVVAEGLGALNANRPAHITGRVNRTMASLLPRGAFTRMLGSMSAQLRAKQTAAHLA
jgi:short-subunit dehydrogenase